MGTRTVNWSKSSMWSRPASCVGLTAGAFMVGITAAAGRVGYDRFHPVLLGSARQPADPRGRRKPEPNLDVQGRVGARRSGSEATTEPRNSRHIVTHAALGHVWKQCKRDSSIRFPPVETLRELRYQRCEF